MVRLLIRIGLSCLASAVGLIVAAAVLDDMTLNGTAFIIAVVVFTISTAVLQPLMTTIAFKYAEALRGGSALVTTLLGLIITSLLSDGLSIVGATTWVLAMLIVWLATLLAGVLLPALLLKKAVTNNNGGNNTRTFG
jgi:putative membrane protein